MSTVFQRHFPDRVTPCKKKCHGSTRNEQFHLWTFELDEKPKGTMFKTCFGERSVRQGRSTSSFPCNVSRAVPPKRFPVLSTTALFMTWLFASFLSDVATAAPSAMSAVRDSDRTRRQHTPVQAATLPPISFKTLSDILRLQDALQEPSSGLLEREVEELLPVSVITLHRPPRPCLLKFGVQNDARRRTFTEKVDTMTPIEYHEKFHSYPADSHFEMASGLIKPATMSTRIRTATRNVSVETLEEGFFMFVSMTMTDHLAASQQKASTKHAMFNSAPA